MGSLPNSKTTTRDGIVDMDEVAPKTELHNPEGSCSSSDSTPEVEGEIAVQEVSQGQKRKGGRKPIYATSEERKQRNRQAQAAFRERRTEYIKQLENTIKHNEDALQSLQQSHRNAADECLMLRYKNSLLERILLEKGIDVQAEIRLKSASPGVPPAKPDPSQGNNSSPLSHPPAPQQSSVRAPGIGPPRIDAARPSPQCYAYNMQSPHHQPTPSSQVSSPPAVKSSSFPHLQRAISPATAEFPPQPQQQQHQPPPPPQNHNLGPYQRPQMFSQQGGFTPGSSVVTPTQTADPMEQNATPQSVSSTSPLDQPHVSTTYYMPPYQKHYDQLDQEYNPQTDAVGDPEAETFPEAHSYRTYRSQSMPQVLQGNNHHAHVQAQFAEANNTGSTNTFFEHFDPMLDADPFGLTASMHFQTPFSFAQNQNRQ